MPIKRHHKWMIGGVSGFLILTIIANSLFIYVLYGQLQLSYNNLDREIMELQTDTQTKLNELAQNLISTKNDLQSISDEVGDIDKEFDLLKASAGEDFSGIIEYAVESVVSVITNTGQGTGFIINSDGYIVTNAHVIADNQGYLSENIRVINSDQRTIPAEYIGFNNELDLAVLKVSENFEILELENSNNIQIGEKVIAIGNPLGLQFSVSQGIVSGTHRTGLNELEAYIQTDAPLNAGNSGGPLINTDGKVIGINNFKISDGEALGFALESNYIKDAVNEISLEELGFDLIE